MNMCAVIVLLAGAQSTAPLSQGAAYGGNTVPRAAPSTGDSTPNMPICSLVVSHLFNTAQSSQCSAVIAAWRLRCQCTTALLAVSTFILPNLPNLLMFRTHGLEALSTD